jgi:hypothetical protein
MRTKNNWVENPTKKQALTFSIIGILSMILLLLSMTNFLTESPFQGKYITLFMLFISSTYTTTRIIRNYVKNKITPSEDNIT